MFPRSLFLLTILILALPATTLAAPVVFSASGQMRALSSQRLMRSARLSATPITATRLARSPADAARSIGTAAVPLILHRLARHSPAFKTAAPSLPRRGQAFCKLR